MCVFSHLVVPLFLPVWLEGRCSFLTPIVGLGCCSSATYYPPQLFPCRFVNLCRRWDILIVHFPTPDRYTTLFTHNAFPFALHPVFCACRWGWWWTGGLPPILVTTPSPVPLLPHLCLTARRAVYFCCLLCGTAEPIPQHACVADVFTPTPPHPSIPPWPSHLFRLELLVKADLHY